MQDFDQKRNEKPGRSVEERTFRLGGETFVGRDRYRPDVLTALEEIRDPKYDATTCSCGHRLHEHPPVAGGDPFKPGGCKFCECEAFTKLMTDPGSSLREQLAAIDATIVGMIESADDARSRYAAVRENDSDPVEVETLMEVIRWLTATDTGRPTGQPSDSSPGPAETGISSTVDSSSPGTPTG